MKTNAFCKLIVTIALCIMALVITSQLEFDVRIKKQNNGLISSISQLVSGAVGTVNTIKRFNL